ncbi:MAG: hypothetical protein EBV65_11810, partial [Gammaproteobacteria bacterium]|nr:hypothetical protein [Gammaproteobacteria bacterium]
MGMSTAYIIDAVRTPVGRKKGSLAAMHPADLGAHFKHCRSEMLPRTDQVTEHSIGAMKHETDHVVLVSTVSPLPISDQRGEAIRDGTLRLKTEQNDEL